MTLLTAEECRERAFRKIIEAQSYGSPADPELVKTAQAWQALGEQVERAEALGTFARPDRMAAQGPDNPR